MKNDKSPGPGSIPVELLKNVPESVLDILRIIFNECLLDEEESPRKRKLEYLTSIHKYGSKKDCKNYRGISVSAIIGRLYGQIIKERLENEITIGEEKSDFTAGRSCFDIFTIKQVIKKKEPVTEIHI